MFLLTLPSHLTRLFPGGHGRVRARQAGGSFLEERNYIAGLGMSQALIAQAVSSLPPSCQGRAVDQWRKYRGLPLPAAEGGSKKERSGLCLEPQRWTPLHPDTSVPLCPSRAKHGCAHTHTHTHMHAAIHTKRQAVRHTIGAEARSMSLQLPSGDKQSMGAACRARLESPHGASDDASAGAPDTQVLQS